MPLFVALAGLCVLSLVDGEENVGANATTVALVLLAILMFVGLVRFARD